MRMRRGEEGKREDGHGDEDEEEDENDEESLRPYVGIPGAIGGCLAINAS